MQNEHVHLSHFRDVPDWLQQTLVLAIGEDGIADGLVLRNQCPALRGAEIECYDGWHYSQTGTEKRCPKQDSEKRIALEVKRLEGLLQRCGYEPSRFPSQRNKPISQALYETLEPTRPIKGLLQLLDVVKMACEEKAPSCNMAFLGPTGVGKTSAQLVIHFARLEKYINSQWVTSLELRDLFKLMNSVIREERDQGKDEMDKLIHAQSIVWSDAADCESSSSKEFSRSLAHLLEYSQAYWVISSNYDLGGLELHPDIGERVLSRMLGQRNGRDAKVVVLQGQDQRTAGLFRKTDDNKELKIVR